MVLWVMPWLQVSGTSSISRVTKARKRTMVAKQQGACYQGPRASANESGHRTLRGSAPGEQSGRSSCRKRQRSCSRCTVGGHLGELTFLVLLCRCALSEQGWEFPGLYISMAKRKLCTTIRFIKVKRLQAGVLSLTQERDTSLPERSGKAQSMTPSGCMLKHIHPPRS